MSISLRYFKLWLIIGWAMVLLLSYFSLVPNPPEFNFRFNNFDKVRHFFAYFILMFWFSQLYQTRSSRMFYIMFFILLGVVLEILQELGGTRHFEYYDMLANSIGVVLAWWVTKGRLSTLLYFVEKRVSG
ncbi:MAG: VanZ family protein [Woeseiaceae bacterium]